MKYLLLSLLTIGLFSCNSNSSATLPPPADLAGYTMETVADSDLQRATKNRADGSLEEQGYVRNGKKTGTWTVYHVEKGFPKTITTYAAGNLDGLFLQFNDRGQIEARTHYKMNEFDGAAMTYKFNRPVTEVNYKMGQLDGISRMYQENTGKLQTETEYKEGKQHGFHKVYNEEGQVVMEYTYENGEKVSGGIVQPN
ncbi:MAG: toxin-antitoxin system YwqK family antitoxin [Saprospiraceae bacterium]